MIAAELRTTTAQRQDTLEWLFTIKIYLNCRNSRIIGSSDNPPATGYYLVKSRPSNVTKVCNKSKIGSQRKGGSRKNAARAPHEMESSTVWATLSHTNDRRYTLSACQLPRQPVMANFVGQQSQSPGSFWCVSECRSVQVYVSVWVDIMYYLCAPIIQRNRIYKRRNKEIIQTHHNKTNYKVSSVAAIVGNTN